MTVMNPPRFRPLLAATLLLALGLTGATQSALAQTVQPDGGKVTAPSPIAATPAQQPAPVQSAEPQQAPDLAPLSDEEAAANAPNRTTVKAKAVVVDINSDKLNYDQAQDVYVATGAVHILISEQNSELNADKVTYDPKKQLLLAEGNVVINKNGEETKGVYAKIDLTRKSALISDPVTAVDLVQVKAKEAYVDPNVIQFKNGKMIIDKKTLMSAARVQGFNGFDANLFRSKNFPDLRFKQPVAPLSSETLDISTPERLTEARLAAYERINNENAGPSSMGLSTRDIQITSHDDGFREVRMKSPWLTWKGHKFLRVPEIELGLDRESGQAYDLGPDIGYNRNLGGFYYGPGWDFRLGSGVAKFSPILTYGNGVRREEDGTRLSNNSGAGIGGLFRYRSEKTYLDAGWTSSSQMLVGRFDQRLTEDGSLRLQASANDFLRRSDFIMRERAKAMVELSDRRVLGNIGNAQFASFVGLGVAQDEFFPTNRRNFFVTPKDADPVTAGRLKLQLQVANNRPLLQIGKNISFGYLGQASMSAYTTGNAYGIFRAGPRMNVNLANRFFGQVDYLMGTTVGSTPFVFDSYYFGKQSLNVHTAVRVNDYLAVGLANNFSLLRDNAQNAAVVGNSVFVMFGPKDVKFNVGYNFINQTTTFGINFFPGSNDMGVDFQRMQVFQPQGYSSPVMPSAPSPSGATPNP